jgi:putative ABC transport system substrate-binding protein
VSKACKSVWCIDHEQCVSPLLDHDAEGCLKIGFSTTDPFFIARRKQVVALAASHAMPAIYPFRWFPECGGLMSYGGEFRSLYQQVGTYAGRILNGAKPVDLPIEQNLRYELVVNLKTAKALSITVPPSLLARADEVIE